MDQLTPPRRLSSASEIQSEDEAAAAPPRRAGWLTIGLLVVADIVGVGVMAMGQAFSQLG